MKEKEGPNAVAFRLAGEWVEDCLAPSTDALAPTLGAQAYADLLPVVRTLAVRPGPALEAFAESALRLQGSSTKRRSADALLAELLWVHEDRFSPLPFFVPPNSAARTALTTWLSAAPRTLWELGARDPVASDALLSLLREIAVRAPSFSRPFSLVNPADLPPIAGKLGPFFHLAHPSRGPIQGPWAKLPEHTQRLALDVARLWMPLEPRLAESVAAAVRGTWAEAYWDR
jgi:pre-rRNA-processing protein IPI1